MGLLSGVGDLLKQFSGENKTEGAGAESGGIGSLLSQFTGSDSHSAVAGGLAEVFKSGQTAPFAQLASQLFSGSGGDQKASVLNTLIASVGPGVLAQLTGSASSPLASLLAGNQAPITPEQAAAIKPEDVQELAEHAEKADPSIIDKMSQLYAAHPQLIQSLGAAAVSIAVAHISKSREAAK